MPTLTFPCIIVSQRTEAEAPRFALFACKASELLQFAAIRRRHTDPDGPQRKLSSAKISAISRFLTKEPRNTIPPAIIITLEHDPGDLVSIDDQNPQLQNVFSLSVEVDIAQSDEDKPGLIIDGQHRALGVSHFSGDSYLNVVALLNVSDMEKAFQFLVINNKVTRVSSDLIRTLALDYKEDELSTRLRSARLSLADNLKYVGIMDTDDRSPFQGSIALVSHEGDPDSRFVPPAAIESAIGVIQKSSVCELESGDELCEFFYSIWRPIKRAWPDLWHKDSRLMHKVSIVAVTAFFADALIAKYDWGELDVTNPEDVEQVAGEVLSFQAKDLWDHEWTTRISDTKAIRDLLVSTLTRVARNQRSGIPWSEGIDLVAD